MRTSPLRVCASLAVLLSAVTVAQNPVPVDLQPDPVQVQTGTDIVLTVVTVPQILYITWLYQGRDTLGLWTGGSAQINPNSASDGVRRSVRVEHARPSVAIEGKNLSLVCKWTAGTQVKVQWGKDGAAVVASSRITISGGSLVIDPANRNDSGTYTCTASNPVSAQTATQSITVYYGPDPPVVTKETPKACVGGGDLLVGQTVDFTCTSISLPPALYSWQWNGQTISSQSGNGNLILQTYSTNQSGQYVCTASNSITGYTSAQGTGLSVVGICLSVGEVAGIVVGCLLLIIIIVLLILLIIFFARRRRERETVAVQKTNPQTTPPDPQPNGARELGQGPQPPLYPTNTHPHRLYTAPAEIHGNTQTRPPNGLHNSDTQQHSGRTRTNGLLHNAAHNTSAYPHNGTDNPAFMDSDARNANTQQQNPNIVIQAGPAQGGAQPQAIHVSLNTLPQTAQQNNSAQMPTIHVSLNSHPTNSQETQQERSSPLTNAANNPAPQTQQNRLNMEQSRPRGESGLSYPSDPQLSAHTDPGYQGRLGLIPTGCHGISFEGHRRIRVVHLSGEQLSAESNSDTTDYIPTSNTMTDYTTHPPIRETTSTRSRSQPRLQSQDTSQSRAPTRRDAPSTGKQARSRSADPRNPNPRSVTQLEAARPTQRSPRTQQDIRGPLSSQTAPRHEATHSSNPQALPLMSQQASVGRSAVSQGTTRQQGPSAPRATDTRALADPNHLPQTHMDQQHRAALIQKPPQGLATQTHPVMHNASPPRQGGAAPVPYPSAQPNPSNLSQAALKAHTEKAQTFHNRNDQTQAALLHPGSKVQHPPPPPPVIPLTEFQALPKERSQHKSPTRGPQTLRAPANIPIAQRPVQQWPNGQSHPAMMPATHHPHHHHHHHHHHHPGKGHVHVSPNRHPAHSTHPQQQQTHRGRPR
ncbi:hypothetical protein Q5P01_011565 [Channa striata]|uniref:Ig-like domain-containing protein n=1 Tax=Channa striata TaxID=64152 RepID=A0AA88MTX3_CHASR|nr:hypothetical protein Q5P01_011565 [Channa striata]